MGDVHFRMEEAEAILELSRRTLFRYIQGQAGDEKRFPHAYLPHKSRRLGYRIPAADLLAYAKRIGGAEGERLQERIERAMARRQREEEDSPVAV